LVAAVQVQQALAMAVTAITAFLGASHQLVAVAADTAT
jgi:hypothetical protein